MADLAIIKAIKDAVTIPVMAKCRIGHIVEAKVPYFIVHCRFWNPSELILLMKVKC